MKRCVFCDREPASWSEEHVTPEWLLDHLRVTAQDQMFQGLGTADGSVNLPHRVHASRRFVEGRVCTGCNAGWMSRLETAASPMLKDLIDGNRGLSSLTDAERALLARWSVKTAYVIAGASVAKWPVPPPHMLTLNGDDGQIPGGVNVFACQRTFDPEHLINFIQSESWPQFLGEGGAPVQLSSARDAYKIAFSYKHLFLLVAFMPHSSAFTRQP